MAYALQSQSDLDSDNIDMCKVREAFENKTLDVTLLNQTLKPH